MCVCVFSVQRRATSRFLQLNICLIYHGVHIVAHNEMLLRKINSWWQHWSAASLNSFQSAPKTWLVIQMNGESSRATMGEKKQNKQLWVTALRASESRTHGDRTVQSNRSQKITALSCRRRRLAAHAQTGSRCSSTPDLHARC